MNGKRPGGWVALAWRYYRDPKFAAVSDGAELLYLRGLAYSGEHETDGNVHRERIRMVRPRARSSPFRLAAELVAAGLWIETDDGFAVPFDTWSRWQETAEQRAQARARNAERQAGWRARRGGNNGGSNALRNATSGAGAGAGSHYVAPLTPGAQLSKNVSSSEPWTDEGGRWFVDPPAASPILEPGGDR